MLWIDGDRCILKTLSIALSVINPRTIAVQLSKFFVEGGLMAGGSGVGRIWMTCPSSEGHRFEQGQPLPPHAAIRLAY